MLLVETFDGRVRDSLGHLAEARSDRCHLFLGVRQLGLEVTGRLLPLVAFLLRSLELVLRPYREQASTSSTMLAEPYIEIHRVRAQAAFETNTMRRLADIVLSRLADGVYPDLGVNVAVHIGTSQLPNSETPFRHHGRRRLEMTIARSQLFREETPYEHV